MTLGPWVGKALFRLWAVMGFVVLAGCVTATSSTKDQPVRRNAEAAQANLNLGVGYIRQKRWELALEKLEKSVKQDPSVVATHNALALAYTNAGDLEKAEKHYDRAVKLDPQDSATLNSYAVFLCRQGRATDAERHFLAAANNPRYPTPEAALTNAGVCLLGVPDKVKAEDYFRRALDRNPTYPDALLRMTVLAYGNENYLQARAFLQRSLNAVESAPSLLCLGYQIETKLGDEQRASDYVTQLKTRFVDNEEAQQCLNSKRDDG